MSKTTENIDVRALCRAHRPAIDAWIASHATAQNQFEQSKLPELVEYIVSACSATIAVISSQFEDRVKYPTLPAIRLYGCEGYGDSIPDVWLLGWRTGVEVPEGTSIHDHMASCAYVRVVQGQIHEVRYAINEREWKAGADILDIKAINRHTLHAGESETIGAPYIHRMLDVPNGALAVSVHGYYPPLDAQNSYVKVGGQLYKIEGWHEDRPSTDCS